MACTHPWIKPRSKHDVEIVLGTFMDKTKAQCKNLPPICVLCFNNRKSELLYQVHRINQQLNIATSPSSNADEFMGI